MKIFSDNTKSVGNTPMIRLNRITNGAGATVLAKLEGRNPSYSVKSRVGVAMIDAAERNGILKPGSSDVTVVEPTSGNTGIALAFVCAARGYPLVITMPDTMSVERRKMLAAYGARIELTPGSEGMNGAIERARRMVTADPGHAFMPMQFSNPANPEIHFQTTGPEIWSATEGCIDIFVAGVGTGGTITGVSRYLKGAADKPVTSVAVEPADSAVLSAIRSGQTPRPASHRIQGIGAGFKPDVLDLSLVDAVETVSNDEAIEYARKLHTLEGVTTGFSGGAAAAAALRLARNPENRGRLIVAILPDSGERYLSTALFD